MRAASASLRRCSSSSALRRASSCAAATAAVRRAFVGLARGFSLRVGLVALSEVGGHPALAILGGRVHDGGVARHRGRCSDGVRRGLDRGIRALGERACVAGRRDMELEAFVLRAELAQASLRRAHRVDRRGRARDATIADGARAREGRERGERVVDALRGRGQRRSRGLEDAMRLVVAGRRRAILRIADDGPYRGHGSTRADVPALLARGIAGRASIPRIGVALRLVEGSEVAFVFHLAAGARAAELPVRAAVLAREIARRGARLRTRRRHREQRAEHDRQRSDDARRRGAATSHHGRACEVRLHGVSLSNRSPFRRCFRCFRCSARRPRRCSSCRRR